MKRRFGPIMQNAYVVPDLEAAIDHWARVVQVGPFFVFDHIPFAELYFRGKPARIDFSAAIAYCGDLQIELILQHDDAPSIYSEFSKGGRWGLQHVAVMTESVDRDLEELASIGVEAVQHGRTGWGARFAYVGTDFHPGGMIELVESGAAILGAFKTIRDASIDWDGKNPIRRFG